MKNLPSNAVIERTKTSTLYEKIFTDKGECKKVKCLKYIGLV